MNEQISPTEIQKVNSFSSKNLSLFLVVILFFLLPVFFIPSQTVLFLVGKTSVLITITLFLFAVWVFERIKNRDFSISKNLLIISAILVPFSYFLSSLFSGSIKITVLGQGFETNSFSMILVLFLLMFFVARLFQAKKKIIYLYISLLLSSAFMFLFHILRLILGPDFLSMGMLNTTASNLIGTWNELGIFFGLMVVLSLLTAVFMKENKTIKVISYITLIIALFFVALVNFLSVWVVLGLLSLSFAIYSLLKSKNGEITINKKNISVISLIVFIVSLIFIFAKGPVGGFLPSLFNISNFEVRPSVTGTVDIVQATLKENPLLGVGPNQFVKQWVLNKPPEINNTQFWNTDFNSGASFILTSLVNIGILGFLAWLLFFGTIIYSGLRLLKISHQNQFNRYISLSVFLATIYLWIFLFIYVPGIVILSLTFLFSGVLLSLFYQDKIIKVKVISLSKSSGKSILLAVIWVSFLLIFVFGGYLFTKKVCASVQAQKSLLALNLEGDLGKSIELMREAADSFDNDLYYRVLSDLDLFQLQAVLNQENVDEETMTEQIQIVFGNAVTNARRAIEIDPRNYQNWVALNKVYGAAVSLGVEGSYDQALESYRNALSLNPNNPALVFGLANLEIANGDIEKAKEYTVASIQMKNNYSEAYYLLSQFELDNGNEEEAIKIIEALAQTTPNDPQVFLQLGLFKFNVENYEEAIPLLERSVNLNPYLVNAVYLLGLSYSEVGESEGAIKVFSYLNQIIPNDNNIISILENLNNGRSALFGIGQQSTEIPSVEPIIEEDVLLELGEEDDENMEVN